MRRGNAFGSVCLSVCLCVCLSCSGSSFQSLDLKNRSSSSINHRVKVKAKVTEAKTSNDYNKIHTFAGGLRSMKSNLVYFLSFVFERAIQRRWLHAVNSAMATRDTSRDSDRLLVIRHAISDTASN